MRHPLVGFVRCRTVAKVLSIGFDVRICFNVPPGNHRRSAARGGPRPAWRPPCPLHAGFDEEVEHDVRLSFCFGLPDVVQMTLGLGLHRFRHRVQHIHGLMDPAQKNGRSPNHPAQLKPDSFDSAPNRTSTDAATETSRPPRGSGRTRPIRRSVRPVSGSSQSPRSAENRHWRAFP